LILCDTLGAKHMSLYGYERKTTPLMERLVEEEGFTVYSNCWSTSCWTPPAHASLFTGMYPREHGTHEANTLLSAEPYSLSEILQMQGYETVGISSNGLVSDFFGFSRGFDSFHDLNRYNLFQMKKNILEVVKKRKGKFNKMLEISKLSAREKNPAIFFKYIMNFLKNRIAQKIHTGALRDATPYTNRALKTGLDSLAGARKPLFLFINLMQVHTDYNPPSETRGRWSESRSPYRRLTHKTFRFYGKKRHPIEVLHYFQDLYDEEVLYLDKVVYEFCKKVNTDNALLIITSDHGENFGEEGHYGHMMSLTDAVSKIPLLVKYPGKNRAGTSGRLCQINDLFATIQDVVESPLPTPESAVSLFSSAARKKALVEVVRPEKWLERVYDKELFRFCFKKEIAA